MSRISRIVRIMLFVISASLLALLEVVGAGGKWY
jgi:hypothetical protein